MAAALGEEVREQARTLRLAREQGSEAAALSKEVREQARTLRLAREQGSEAAALSKEVREQARTLRLARGRRNGNKESRKQGKPEMRRPPGMERRCLLRPQLPKRKTRHTNPDLFPTVPHPRLSQHFNRATSLSIARYTIS